MAGGGDPRFVGRAAELKTFGRCVDAVAAGRGVTILVEGEPGIGKTRLVQEGLTAFAALGGEVLHGAAEELERTLPFGAAARALALEQSSEDPERHRISELLWSDGAPRSEDLAPGFGVSPRLRREVVDAAVQLVRRRAAAGPLSVVLEDLQWADPSSLAVLDALGRRLRDFPVAVIGTFRSAPRSRELDAFVETMTSRGATLLRLAPLDEQVVSTLVASLLSATPGAGLLAQVRRTGGNPLFVIELVRTLAHENLLVVEGGRAEIIGEQFPVTLPLTLLRRLRALPRATLHVLQVASVLGSRFRAADLGLVTRRGVAELLPYVDDAMRAGVLDDADPYLVFRHDLLREALYGDLAPAVRAGLHVDAAWALAEAGARPLTVAEHLVVGATPDDVRAVEWLRRAARDAALRAPAVAAELLERAVEVAGPHDRRRDALLADLVSALYWSGRLREAQELAQEILSRPHDPAVDVAVRVALVDALLGQLRFVEGLTEAAVALRQPDLPERARRRLRAEACWGQIFAGDLPAAVVAAEEIEAEAKGAGDDEAACVALNVQCHARTIQGRIAEALAAGHESAALSQRSEAARRFYPGPMLGAALIEADRFDEADRVLMYCRSAEELGLAVRAIAQWATVWVRCLDGRWADAEAEGEAAFALAAEAGAGRAVFVEAQLAMIAIHRDDLASAEQALAGARRTWSEMGAQFRAHWLSWARALLEEAKGSGNSARVSMEEAWQFCATLGAAGDYPMLGPDAVRLALKSGDREGARAAVAAVSEAALRIDAPWAKGASLRCAGLLANDPDLLLEAAAVLRHSPRPLERAVACEDAASALRSRGRTEEAVPVLEEALHIYEDLAAKRDIARAHALLRGLGVRRGRRGTRRRPESGWASLTATEAEVVRLVAEGLTNREVAERLFVSTRTVETHVAHVYAKLGITSRQQLRTGVAARTLAATGPGGAARPPSPE